MRRREVDAVDRDLDVTVREVSGEPAAGLNRRELLERGASVGLSLGAFGLAFPAISGAARTFTSAAQKGGTIIVAAAQGIPQLNPITQSLVYEKTLFPLLWDGLVEFTPHGGLAPGLAESWEPSANLMRWTFKLRKGVKFHNGKAFTAEDVARTFKYALGLKTPYDPVSRLGSIKEVRARGPLVAEFILHQADAILPIALSELRIIDVDGLKFINKRPNGTGPFKLKGFVPDDHAVVVRNDAYWGGPAPLDEIRLGKAADPTAAVTALRSGDIDVLWSISNSGAQALAKNKDITILKPATPGQLVILEVDTTSPPFDDLRARQALAYATNRKGILDAAYFGFGVVSPANVDIATTDPAFNKALTPYPFDLKKAKELFAAVGVTELIYSSVAGQYPEWRTMGEVLQSDLRKIGVTVKIVEKEISAWSDIFYPPGKKYPGLITPNFLSEPPDPFFALNFFKSGRCECNLSDKKTDQLLAKAKATRSAKGRQKVYNQLQLRVHDNVPVISPLQQFPIAGLRKKVKGAWMLESGTVYLNHASLEA